ncbi:MAG: hypothetical protein V3S08_03975 [Phycisphaerales bacterium]|nr:MAG: hypothetical protein E2O40_05310 [Planctomycetota bacterium]
MRSQRTARSLRRPPSSNIAALIALNAVLIGLLAAVTFAPTVSAQSIRARGAFTMVAGGANNSLSSVVYIIDTVNQEMTVMTYESATRNVKGIAYRNLAADAANQLGRVRAGG